MKTKQRQVGVTRLQNKQKTKTTTVLAPLGVESHRKRKKMDLYL